MASCSEAGTLLDIVKTSASIVQHVRNGRYKLSQDFNNFEDKVNELQLKHEVWEGLLHEQGAQVQKLVKPSLEIAQKTLHKEESTVRKRKGGCWPACLEISFPTGRVNDAIDSVSRAFERIPESIKGYNAARAVLDEVTTSDIAALPFRHDPKYVVLSPTVGQVRSALEDFDGPSVVTLYGPPGSGKTSMAKYLALLYDSLRNDNQKHHQCILGRHRNSRRAFSDGVFFLVCGPEATSKTLHLELWQNLGCRANFDDSSTHWNAYNTDEKLFSESRSESMLQKQLVGRLANRSALIILDDVQNSGVLEGILLPGKHIKYLVTSQDKRIWNDAEKIDISRPSREDARQILFNHVPEFPECQPDQPDIQNAANYMIEMSDFNPLVLANLALTISGERAADPHEWRIAKKYVLDIFEDTDMRPARSPVIFGESYRHTVASTMTMAVNSMPTEAKHFLFLVAMCGRPSVPEIVLMMFFKSLHGSLARFRFRKCASYLEDRAFIHLETHAVDWTRSRERTWSVHGLRRHFLLMKQNAEIERMVSSLLHGRNEDQEIITSLYLMFAKTSASSTYEDEISASESLGIPRDSNSTPEFTCRSIRPFVSLLHPDHDIDEEWKEEAHSRTEQIISHYVRRGELNDRCLSVLLAIPQAQLATCWALETMARSENKPLLTEDNGSSLRNLLALLDEREHAETQSWAAVALGALARQNHDIIMGRPEALQRLLHLLHSASFANDNYNVQMYAAWALGNLAATPNAKKTIAEYVGMVDALLALLSKINRPDSQIQAAYALRRLAYSELMETVPEAPSRQTCLIAHSAMLPTLVFLLENDVHPDVQSEAVRTIGDLAASRENKVAIATHPKILEILVAMLSKRKMSGAQRHRATYTLRRLLAGYPQLARMPSAFQRLVDILVDDDNLDAQLEAAHCMSFLSRQEEFRASFSSNRDVLIGLVRLLDKDERPKSQLIAVGTLANLSVDSGNKHAIASMPGALHRLVKLLPKNQIPDPLAAETGKLAVRCLGFLSFEHYDNQLKIGAMPGALTALVNLLQSGPCMDTSDAIEVQHLAAWTVSNLARAEPNRAAIRGFTGVLENLKCLTEDDEGDPTILSHVAGSIELLVANSSSSEKAGAHPTSCRSNSGTSTSTSTSSSSFLSSFVHRKMVAVSTMSNKRLPGAPEPESPAFSFGDESGLSEVQMPSSPASRKSGS